MKAGSFTMHATKARVKIVFEMVTDGIAGCPSKIEGVQPGMVEKVIPGTLRRFLMI